MKYLFIKQGSVVLEIYLFLSVIKIKVYCILLLLL